MTTDTSLRILEYIHVHSQAKASDLVRAIGITNVAIHRQLNKLLEQGKISKVGKPPLVFYIPHDQKKQIISNVPIEAQDFINTHYAYVTPRGEFLTGMNGFTQWVFSIQQEKYLIPLAQEYIKVRKEADSFMTTKGWIDATKAKEFTTFGDTVLDKLLYKDFYSLEKFGKTRLGQMVLYAKTSQNIELIKAITDLVKPIIEKVIQTYDIDTIVYVPPSIKREVQLMTELRDRLGIQLPEIALVKAYAGDIIVSQKSLSKLQDRIINAQQTIFIDIHRSAKHPKNVLIIDDAVGSGATLHETAKKIKELLQPKGKIVGFALVGSMKGFEVIREI